MIKQTAKTVFSPKKYKKREKASFKRVEMLITKKVIAMAVAEVSGSLAITFSKLNPPRNNILYLYRYYRIYSSFGFSEVQSFITLVNREERLLFNYTSSSP